MGAVLGFRRPLGTSKDGLPNGVGPRSRHGLRPLHVFTGRPRLAVLDDERRPRGWPRPRSNRPNHQQLVPHRVGSRRRWVGRVPLQRARVRSDVPHVQGGRPLHHVGGPSDHRQAVSRGAHFHKQRGQTPAQLVCASREDVGALSIGAWHHGRSETTRLECVVQHDPLARPV